MTPEFRTWEDTERNLGTLDGVTYTACRKHNAILSHISKTFEWCSDLVWQKNVETPVNKLTRCELQENVLFHLGSSGVIWIMFAHVGSVPLNSINYVFVALSISGYLYADWHVIFWIPIGIQIEHFLSHNEFMLFCKHVSRLVSPAGNNGNIFMLWRYTVLHILRTSIFKSQLSRNIWDVSIDKTAFGPVPGVIWRVSIRMCSIHLHVWDRRGVGDVHKHTWCSSMSLACRRAAHAIDSNPTNQMIMCMSFSV